MWTILTFREFFDLRIAATTVCVLAVMLTRRRVAGIKPIPRQITVLVFHF